MTTGRFVCLLRGINVGGHNLMSMASLRALFTELGFENVSTYLQSGNVLFSTDQKDRAALTKQLQTAVEAKTGHNVSVLIRDQQHIQWLVEHNPYSAHAERDPRMVHVSFFSGQVDEETRSSFALPANVLMEYVIHSNHMYSYFPQGVARSKLSHSYLERHLNVRITGRNWRTLQAIHERLNR